MSANTIDLTTISSDVYENFSKLEFSYGRDRVLQTAIHRHRNSQWKLSNELFTEWLTETNLELLDDVEKFIERSLGSNNGMGLFSHVYSNVIHPATVILGMQASDHMHTMDMIEDRVRNKFNPAILRLEPSLSRRGNLLELLRPFKDDDHLLVMVEQTEIMDHMLIESLIYYLYDMLDGTETKRIMVLFFMSGSWKNMDQLIPVSAMNRMRLITTIVKEPEDLFANMQEKLLNPKDISLKVGPDLIDLFYNEFVETDASIVNLRYLYEYTMYEHYSKKVSLLSLSPDELKKIVKSQTLLQDILEKTECFKSKGDFRKNLNELIKIVDNHRKIHEFLVSQIKTYFILIRDETREDFPSCINEIYSELSHQEHDDLAQSLEFNKAIDKLKMFQVKSLRKRMSRCIQSRKKVTADDPSQDVLSIIRKYDNKFENNDNDKKIISGFVNELRKHAQTLHNPLKISLQESLYYNDTDKVRSRTIPANRYNALVDYPNPSSYFGLLYSLIHQSPGEISESDLFNEFTDSINNSSPELPQKRKLTPALIKAIYLDLIDCMIHQGLIKRDLRQSQFGILKRIVWL